MLTRKYSPTDVSQKILNCLFDSTERYNAFHIEQFLERSKKSSEVIYKVNLPPLANKFIIKDTTCEKPKQKDKKFPKKMTASQRKVDIAKGKGAELRDILKYDVMESNMLYDGGVMAKHEKSKINGKMQNRLPEQFILHDLRGA